MGGFGDWIDTAAEVAEHGINAGQAAAEQKNIADWTAEGRQAGEAEAREDYASGHWQSNPIQEVVPADPHIEPGSTYNEFHMPSFTSPILTALEVALTPTELNVGEFAHSNAFEAGHSDGYSDGMFHTFDQQLDDRFAPPPEPAPASVMPSAIDCAIPPLDPSPSVDWGACDTGGGSYDSGGSGYDGGGSSSGGSSDSGSSGGSSD